MGLSSASPLFTTAWQEKYAKVVERSMIATITVYTPGVMSYNPATDAWTETGRVTHYGVGVPDVASTGAARVQPVRSGIKTDIPGNDAEIQTVLFSIPIAYKAVDFRKGQQVRVTVSPLNPLLLKYAYSITDVVDSSNPIERTFYCTVDQEVVL